MQNHPEVQRKDLKGPEATNFDNARTSEQHKESVRQDLGVGSTGLGMGTTGVGTTGLVSGVGATGLGLGTTGLQEQKYQQTTTTTTSGLPASYVSGNYPPGTTYVYAGSSQQQEVMPGYGQTTGLTSGMMTQGTMSVPSQIKIGHEKMGVDHFNDIKSFDKVVLPYRISQVKIQWNKDHIMGVKFTYLDANNKKIKGHNIVKFRPFSELFGTIDSEVFKIADDDELLEVYGRVGTHINKLCFRTYKSHIGEFGHNIGEQFSYRFPGHTFGAASGGYGEFLDYLILQVIPLQGSRQNLLNLWRDKNLQAM